MEKCICLNCGEEFLKYPSRIHRTFCSKSCGKIGKSPWNKGTKGVMKSWNRGLKVGPLSEEHKRKISESEKGKMASLETRKRISLSKLGDKNPVKNKEVRERISKTLKGRKISKEHLSNILRSCCARPNKFEARAMDYLNSIYANKFKYTGNGSFIVNHRSADAYSEELKTVALFNGIYWHLKRYGFENTEQAKGAIELIESIPFLESGYKVIFIWEDELP